MTNFRRYLSWTLLLLVYYACLANASQDRLEQGIKLFNNGEFVAAKLIFEVLHQEDPENPRINYHLAKSCIKERHYRSAFKHLEKSLEIDHTHPDTQYLLGITYISLLNDVGIFRKLIYASKVKKAWQKALKLDSKHLQSRFALTSYYMNAPGIAGGDMDEAQKQIEILFQLHQGYGALANAMFLEKNDQIAAAEQYFAKAVLEIDDRAGPLFNQANFYVRQERFDEALTKLQAYDASDRKSWDDPDDLFVHILRASIEAGLGDNGSAKRELEQALALDPGNTIHKVILDRMAEL